MKYYIFFPTGLDNVDPHDSNVDINVGVVNKDKSVSLYVATLFTRKNINYFLRQDGYLWASDMIIIEQLNLTQIKFVIHSILNKNEEDDSMTRVREYINEKKFLSELTSFNIIECGSVE